MKKTKLILITVLSLATISLMNTGCSKVEGCTNSSADNYDSDADEDDGSCYCSSPLTFSNYDGEDYTIVSSSGKTWVINEWGDLTLNYESDPAGTCFTYEVRDGGSTGTLIGTTSHCSCDASKTVKIDNI